MKSICAWLVFLSLMGAAAGCGDVKDFLKGNETAAADGGQSHADGEAPNVSGRSSENEDTTSEDPEPGPSSASVQEQADAPAAGGGPLRYRWRSGRQYGYKFHIEVERGDEIEILSGTPVYTVKQVEGGDATLAFSGRLSERHRSKSGFPRLPSFRRMSIFSPFTGLWGSGTGRNHQLTITDRGEIKRFRGDSQLPYLLGNLSMLVIEPLPEKAVKEWTVSNEVSISSTPSSPFPRPSFGPFGRRTDATQTSDAKETTKYTIRRTSVERVVIAKEYELKSSATVGGKPKYAMTGEGEFVFDRRRGVPYKLDYTVTVETTSGNSTTRTPVRVSYEMLSDEALDKLQREADARTPRPIDDEELEQLLAALRSNDREQVRMAALRLEHALPQNRDRAPVAEALQPLLQSSHEQTRRSAAAAMKTWATSESVPALLALLQEQSAPVRWSAIAALGNVPDQRVVEPLAGRLTVGIDRIAASKALKNLGPMAETAVLDLIDSEERALRQAVVGILKKIGTEKSIPALQKLAEHDENNRIRRAAEAAIKQIRARP